MVLDVLLEASVSNAYLDAGVEILNGTKTPQQAMDDIRAVALAGQGEDVGAPRASRSPVPARRGPTPRGISRQPCAAT